MKLTNVATLTTILLGGLSAALPQVHVKDLQMHHISEEQENLKSQHDARSPISDMITKCMYPAVNACLPKKGKGSPDSDGCIVDQFKHCVSDKEIFLMPEHKYPAFTKTVRIGWHHCHAKNFRHGVNAWAMEQRCERDQLSKALDQHLDQTFALIATIRLQNADKTLAPSGLVISNGTLSLNDTGITG